jgi:hypothetical protein
MRPQHWVGSRFRLKLLLLCLVFLCACYTSDTVVAYSARVIEALDPDQRQTIELFDIAKKLTAQVEEALLPRRLTRLISEISDDESRDFLMTACLWCGSLSWEVPE